MSSTQTKIHFDGIDFNSIKSISDYLQASPEHSELLFQELLSRLDDNYLLTKYKEPKSLVEVLVCAFPEYEEVLYKTVLMRFDAMIWKGC